MDPVLGHASATVPQDLSCAVKEAATAFDR
jgi:hypothetical protein